MITIPSVTPDNVADFLERMNVRRKRLTQDCLRRERLGFTGHLDAKCLLYKAPRGFGKSVQIALCAQTAADQGDGCVYLDLSSFWQESVCEADFIANAIVAVLSPPDLSGTNTRSCPEIIALRVLRACERPVVLCLDGVTGSATTLRFLKTITLETPKSVRLVVSERLPGSLVILSVLSDVVTIGPEELSFTLDETRSALSLEADRAKKIFTMAGGWPLLCALAGRSNASGDAIVHLPEIQAYFENDVLAQLPQPLRTCLINASWLEEITAEACDYAFKTDESGRKLAELVSHHSLLTASVDRLNCFEINRTLRAYLRNRFIEINGSRRSYFLKRIALWHWRRKEYRQVVNVALRARDHNWAQPFTDQALLDLALRQGEVEALTIWFTGIPRAKLFQMPSLAAGYAWVLFFSQRASEAHDILDNLANYRGAATTGQEDPNGWAELVRAIGLGTHDEMKAADESCAVWVETYGMANPVGSAAAQTCRAFIAASDRRFSVLSDQIVSATVLSGAVRHRYAFGWLAAAGVLARLLTGDIHAARREIRRAQENEDVAHEHTPFVKGMIASFELQIQAEDVSVTPDESIVQEALDFALAFGVTDVVWNTVRSAVETYIRQGDTSQAFLLLERCRLLAKERGLQRLGILVRLGTEVFAMGAGVSTPLATEPLPLGEDLLFLPNQNRAIQAESALLKGSRFLRDGKLGPAERQTRKALSDFAAVGDQRGQIRAQYTLATTLYLMGEEKQALKQIADADLEAQRLGALRSLINRRHVLRVIRPEAKALLGRTRIQTTKIGKLPQNVQVTEFPIAYGSAPIGQKQMAVLQLAALGLSNKEIAVRLHVSEDTVKWHFRKILRALEAGNRTEAVLIARSAGLI